MRRRHTDLKLKKYKFAFIDHGDGYMYGMRKDGTLVMQDLNKIGTKKGKKN